MKSRVIWISGLLLMTAWFWAGCTEDDSSNDPNQQIQTNHNNNFPTNQTPVSLAGRTYTFTVTGNGNFPEPFNSGYTIDFISETSYIMHPSGQNTQSRPEPQGNYTYEAAHAVIHFAETSPDPTRIFEAALTFVSPNTGTAHLTARAGASQDAVFFQTAP